MKEKSFKILAFTFLMIVSIFMGIITSKERNKSNFKKVQSVSETIINDGREPGSDELPEEYFQNKDKSKNVELNIDLTGKEESVSDNIIKYYPDMPNKLEKLGFKNIGNSDNCRNIEVCYTNDEYRIDFGSSVWFEISKNVSKNNISSYDTSKDFIFISELFENKELPKVSGSVNTILHTLDKYNTTYFSFNINAYGQYMFIRHSSNELEYSITDELGSNYKNGYFLVDDVNGIISNSKKEGIPVIKRTLYDALMETNKDHYKYYDYSYKHFDDYVCNIKVTDGHYTYENSYCHGGTSDTSFKLSYNSRENKLKVEDTIRTSYFYNSYLEFINNDLAYFSEKTNQELKLSPSDIDELSTAVKDKLENYSIKVSDKMIINIKYKYYNEYADYYYLTYEFM